MIDKHRVEIFISYAHEDANLLRKLEAHLRPLAQTGITSIWHDRKILAGQSWEQAIEEHLQSANLILLLISPDFFASYDCSRIMETALRRVGTGETRVVPILLRYCDWKDSPVRMLQMLPTNGEPITHWHNEDEAFSDVFLELQHLATSMQVKPSRYEANSHLMRALLLPETHTANLLDAALPKVLVGVGNLCTLLHWYNAALWIYERALRLNPQLSKAYSGQSKVYKQLARRESSKLFRQAQHAYKKARQFGVKHRLDDEP